MAWTLPTCWGMPSMRLSIKKFEKTKIPHYLNNHTKYPYESIKLPSNAKLIFWLFKVEDGIVLYIKI
jgi:hypothetical protein